MVSGFIFRSLIHFELTFVCLKIFNWRIVDLQCCISFRYSKVIQELPRCLSGKKKSTCNAGDTGDMDSVPGSGKFPGGGHSNRSSMLAWRIPWTEEPGGLQSMGSNRVRNDWSNWSHTHTQSDSVLFVRGFLTLQLGDISPESGHFWLPQGPGCRWSGRTVAGPYTNNFVQTKKGAYSWWMPSSARVHGQQARQNWHLVSVCLLGHPHSPRAQLVCLGMVALRMSWGFLSFILKSSGGGERRGCFLGLSFLVFPWIQERNLGLFYQIRSI